MVEKFNIIRVFVRREKYLSRTAMENGRWIAKNTRWNFSKITGEKKFFFFKKKLNLKPTKTTTTRRLEIDDYSQRIIIKKKVFVYIITRVSKHSSFVLLFVSLTECVFFFFFCRTRSVFVPPNRTDTISHIAKYARTRRRITINIIVRCVFILLVRRLLL